MNVIERVRTFRRRHGVAALLRHLPAYLYRLSRPYLPSAGHLVYNGVTVSERSTVLDRYLPTALFGAYDRSDYEEQYVGCIRQYVSEGERVVVVGGGKGVSTVAAARQVGESGTVVVYEGSETEVKNTRVAAELNGVASRVKVNHAIVSYAVSLRGSAGTATTVSSAEIDDCDTLCIDADGAEFEILEGLEVRPQRIILEHHMVLDGRTLVREADPEAIHAMLDDLGYDVVDERVSVESLSPPVDGHDSIEERLIVATRREDAPAG